MTSLVCKIDEKTKRILLNCGVSPGLTQSFSLDLESNLSDYTISRKSGVEFVSVSRQIAILNKLNISKFDKSFVVLLTADPDFVLARKLGIFLFRRAIDYYSQNPVAYMGAMPYWRFVPGGYSSPIKPLAYNDLPLFIDGLSVDMTNSKLENAFDLIHGNENRARVVMLFGNEARNYAIDKLGINPLATISFGYSRKTYKV